ncbi:YbhN family protein [Tsukamurella sp. 8F]|uniref:lysylphosphatidylglycerol synthase transmembrane domain-containing protein n=1 Tax=Tsukamurella sp. 8F TaxID=3031961 RepID=UPI0023B99EB1|nr:YbhN family protein [Tsukamurella sp. 8F]MDF0588635.1 YbhN family protein [Tsukamurella sp. 8F]
MSDDGSREGAADAPAAPPKATRRRFWWARRAGIALLVVVLAVEIVAAWPRLHQAWDQLGNVRWEWLVACIVAVFFSFDSYAQVIRTLMHSAGVKCTQRQALGLQFASNAVSQSLPGGQVIAPTMVYRRTRMWGASRVVAAWQIVMGGLLMSAGLAVLGLAGALAAGAKTSPYSVFFSVALFVAVVVMFQYVASHPDGIYTVGARLIRWTNDLRSKPEDFGLQRWRDTLDELGAVKLSRRYGAEAFAWSMFNWVADVACLAFACYAVGSHPGLAALCVAYAASKAVNTISPIPGGVGLVEAALVPALVWAGMPGSAAISATVIYRLVSYFLVVAIGWIVFFFGYRGAMAHDPDDDPGTGPQPAQPS